MKIVTFTCSDSIHIYYKGCGLKPASPFCVHATIEDAEKVLKKRGLRAMKILKYK